MRAKRKNQGWYDGDGRYPAEPGSMPPYPEGNGPGYPSQDGPYEEGPYLGGAYEEDAGYDPDYGEYTEKYPEGYGDGSWVPDDEAYEDDEDYDEPAEKPETRSIFRPETRKPNFVISVLLNTIRVLLVVVLLAGVAGLGTVVGIAKGYVDTAPDLNLVKLGSQAQTSFIYDRNKKLITEYKGTENRVLVSLEAERLYRGGRLPFLFTQRHRPETDCGRLFVQHDLLGHAGRIHHHAAADQKHAPFLRTKLQAEDSGGVPCHTA